MRSGSGPPPHRPLRYRLAILASVLLLLALIHYTTVYAPIEQRISHLRQQIQSAQMTMLKDAQSRARVAKLEQQLEQARSKLTERHAMTSGGSAHPGLLEQVSKSAQTAGLRVVRFRPGDERQRETYIELPLELDLDGTFRDFIRFLRALAKLPQLSQIGDLTILSQETVERRLSLDISLEILTYRLPQQFDEHQSQPLTRIRAPTAGRHLAAKIEKLSTEKGSLATLRDPFHAGTVSACDERVKGLHSYDLDELQLVGVVWEPHDPKGLVMDGAQLGHIIIPGSPIGNRGGIVKAITPTRVIIEERLPNGANAARSMGLRFPSFTATIRDETIRGQGEGVTGGMGERETSLQSHCAPKP